MKSNNYKLFEKTMENGDVWHIHYLRVNHNLVRIGCDLLRPNRRFWQSKYLWSDWTYTGAENADFLEKFADDVIDNYYHQLKNENKLDDFFK